VHEPARLKLSTVSERIDVALRLCFIEAVFGLKLRYQVVLVLESGYLLVGELAPLLLDFASHACVGFCTGCRLIVCHCRSPKFLDEVI
jgi:hypothetical protein